MSGGDFTITSTNDGASVPAEGFTPGGNFRLDVMGGDTIEAELHYRQPDGSFKKIPSNDADIDADYSRLVIASHDDVYKISVIGATGAWAVRHRRVAV